jgi:hypothetical protein
MVGLDDGSLTFGEAKRMKSGWFFLGIFGLAGVVFLGAGIGIFVQTYRFVATAVSAAGVVTENVWRAHSSIRGAGAFFSRVRFRTAEGQQITVVMNTGFNPPAHQINEAVPVLYDREHPQHAAIRSFGELWTLPLVDSILGFVFCSICAGAWIWKDLITRRGSRKMRREHGSRSAR